MTLKCKNGGYSWETFVQKIVKMEVICTLWHLENKSAEGISKTLILPLDDSTYALSDIFCNFFMPIIAKCQPLHRPSMQSPPKYI